MAFTRKTQTLGTLDAQSLSKFQNGGRGSRANINYEVCARVCIAPFHRHEMQH